MICPVCKLTAAVEVETIEIQPKDGWRCFLPGWAYVVCPAGHKTKADDQTQAQKDYAVWKAAKAKAEAEDKEADVDDSEDEPVEKVETWRDRPPLL